MKKAECNSDPLVAQCWGQGETDGSPELPSQIEQPISKLQVQWEMLFLKIKWGPLRKILNIDIWPLHTIHICKSTHMCIYTYKHIHTLKNKKALHLWIETHINVFITGFFSSQRSKIKCVCKKWKKNNIHQKIFISQWKMIDLSNVY